MDSNQEQVAAFAAAAETKVANVELQKQLLEQKYGADIENIKKDFAEIAPKIDSMGKTFAQSSEIEALKSEVFALKQVATQPTVALGDGQDASFSAFSKFLTSKGANFSEMAQFTATPLTTDTADGYLLPINVQKQINTILQAENNVRQLFSAVTLPSSNYRITIADPLKSQAQWVGETDPRDTTQNAVIVDASGTFGEMYAMPEVSDKMLSESWADVSSFVLNSVAQSLAYTEAQAFLLGDGDKKPKGFLNVPMSVDDDSTRPLKTFQYLDVESVDYDVLNDLITSLRSSYLGGACFVMNRRTLNGIRKIKDSKGDYVWNQGNVNNGSQGYIFGYPVVTVDLMPDVATGAIPVMFGNFKRAYTICDVSNTVMRVNPFSHPGFTQYYTTRTVGGIPVDSCAAKFLKIKVAPAPKANLSK